MTAMTTTIARATTIAKKTTKMMMATITIPAQTAQMVPMVVVVDW